MKDFGIGSFMIPPRDEKVFAYNLGELFKLNDVKTCTVVCAQPGQEALTSVKIDRITLSE